MISLRNLSGGVSPLPGRELQIEWKSAGDPKSHLKSYTALPIHVFSEKKLSERVRAKSFLNFFGISGLKVS